MDPIVNQEEKKAKAAFGTPAIIGSGTECKHWHIVLELYKLLVRPRLQCRKDVIKLSSAVNIYQDDTRACRLEL